MGMFFLILYFLPCFFSSILQVPAILSIITNLGCVSTVDINLTSLYKYSIEAILVIWKLSNEDNSKKLKGCLSERGIILIKTLESFLNNNTGWVPLNPEEIQMELQVGIFCFALGTLNVLLNFKHYRFTKNL